MNLPIINRKIDGSRLISDWCLVTTEDGTELRAYYHVWFGWMIMGDVDETWRFGYRPLNSVVKSWKKL